MTAPDHQEEIPGVTTPEEEEEITEMDIPEEEGENTEIVGVYENIEDPGERKQYHAWEPSRAYTQKQQQYA